MVRVRMRRRYGARYCTAARLHTGCTAVGCLSVLRRACVSRWQCTLGVGEAKVRRLKDKSPISISQ